MSETLNKTPKQIEHGKKQIALMIQLLTDKMKVNKAKQERPYTIINDETYEPTMKLYMSLLAQKKAIDDGESNPPLW